VAPSALAPSPRGTSSIAQNAALAKYRQPPALSLKVSDKNYTGSSIGAAIKTATKGKARGQCRLPPCIYFDFFWAYFRVLLFGFNLVRFFGG